MTTWCWAFEAQSIQAYLLEGGRLADAVGASELVGALLGELGPSLQDTTPNAADGSLLGAVWQAAGSPPASWARRGGGAFLTCFAGGSAGEAAARRVRALWHAALGANAPGLRWADGLAVGSDAAQAMAAAWQRCESGEQADRVAAPTASPVAARMGRTGQAASTQVRSARGLEAVDAATAARRRHGRPQSAGAAPGLVARFSDDTSLAWPRNLNRAEADEDGSSNRWATVFPFAGEDAEVAMVHADGNGLGLLLARLRQAGGSQGDELVRRLAAFSRAVSVATLAAVRDATAAVLVPAAVARPEGRAGQQDPDRVVPARPLVLGGDDLTIILRADVALPFVEHFLLAFERHTRSELAAAWLQTPLGVRGLTAAAGVVFVKANYPFVMAQAMASDLCTRAKGAVRSATLPGKQDLPAPVSAIAFARVTQALADAKAGGTSPDGTTLTLPQVQQGGTQATVTLGLPAYVLGRGATGAVPQGLPAWDDLKALAEHLGADTMPRGPARRLITEWQQDEGLAKQRYARWRKQRGRTDADGLKHIDALMTRLAQVTLGAVLPAGPTGTPWPDAVLLRDVLAADEGAQDAAADGQEAA